VRFLVATLIDGKKIADDVRQELRPRLAALAARGVVPGLAAVLVGDNPASKLYVKMKGKACEEMGLAHWTLELPADTSEPRLVEEVDRLNKDPKVHGILVQQPLPPQIPAAVATSPGGAVSRAGAAHPSAPSARPIQSRVLTLPPLPEGPRPRRARRRGPRR